MAWPRLSDEERSRLLERARDHCYFLDVGDSGARLCRANMPYGIAKIQWIQQEIGIDPDARYISTPDSTVTRNMDRWASGYGYGGAIEWSGAFMPLELKPNYCGMLVCGLADPPDLDGLESTVAHLAETSIEVSLVQAHWDMHRGNHFLNLYEVSDPPATSGHPYVAIMHSSGTELRSPNKLGPGLYLVGHTPDSGLDSKIEILRTPFGLTFFLQGEAAEIYFEYAGLVERFAKKRRAAYAERIFGDDVEILFNETHQGLDGRGRMLLGCYRTSPHLDWVPITLRPDLPAYLVAPRQIYSESSIEREGLTQRARSTRCFSSLIDARILPHGGGYAYTKLDGHEIVVDDQGPSRRRGFRAGPQGWFKNVRDLPFSYRGEEVIRRIEELGSGERVARLDLVKRLEG